MKWFTREYAPHAAWTGRRVTNGKEIFIETNKADWNHRLGIWKCLHYDDPGCPCPMPQGHVMFLNYNAPGTHYRKVYMRQYQDGTVEQFTSEPV